MMKLGACPPWRDRRAYRRRRIMARWSPIVPARTPNRSQGRLRRGHIGLASACIIGMPDHDDGGTRDRAPHDGTRAARSRTVDSAPEPFVIGNQRDPHRRVDCDYWRAGPLRRALSAAYSDSPAHLPISPTIAAPEQQHAGDEHRALDHRHPLAELRRDSSASRRRRSRRPPGRRACPCRRAASSARPRPTSGSRRRSARRSAPRSPWSRRRGRRAPPTATNAISL